MTAPAPAAEVLPAFVPPMVAQLRRRQLQVGLADLDDLRRALRAGFGLSSKDELRELCVALWAKSPAEAQVVRVAFAGAGLADWGVNSFEGVAVATPGHAPAAAERAADDPDADQDEPETPGDAEVAQTRLVRPPGAGALPLRTGGSSRGFVLTPQYPLAAREVAQAWRHLRRPVRYGPATELDIGATIRERGRHAVVTPPVLVPRRRNAMRLLLLIDRHGSMTPFHGYVDYVVAAIRNAGRLDDVDVGYYHDLPGSLEDRIALEQVDNPLRADLDPVLGQVPPLRGGRVYADPGLAVPRPLDPILGEMTGNTAVLVISDGGAARRTFDLVRLLDSVALLKAIGADSTGVAWLNPVRPSRWPRTTAGQVARHVPMFPFTREGLYQAVDALRGRAAPVERPLW
jgi:uncharacterized protein with von Willebrand factor type A (vWA) domain